MNILGKRYIFFGISLLIIIPGLILASLGLPLSIDFTGGVLMEVKFPAGTNVQPADIITLFNDQDIRDTQVITTESETLQLRFSFPESYTDEQKAAITTGSLLSDEFGAEVTVVRLEEVGATIGQEVAGRAAAAVGIAALVVIIYIFLAFRSLPHALRYGLCAIIAMVHDVAIVLSLGAIGGRLFNWQVDSLFLTALLTVIGFSVQDKIVVFDRIRENSNIYKRLPFETLVNHSIIQTLQRSINTQLMTVEFMLLALILFGGVTLREFATVLLVGLFMGTYSSIFIAAPILVVWENKEWKNWFKRGSTTPSEG
jgi:preprotein translocase subunit SecF